MTGTGVQMRNRSAGNQKRNMEIVTDGNSRGNETGGDRESTGGNRPNRHSLALSLFLSLSISIPIYIYISIFLDARECTGRIPPRGQIPSEMPGTLRTDRGRPVARGFK